MTKTTYMTKLIDVKEREDVILDLIVEAYIKETNPVSSSHLCQKYNLPYSSATIRNVMETLEEKGLLSHIHTSSGRIPTKKGFKHYVEHLKREEMIDNRDLGLDLHDTSSGGEQIIDKALDVLSENSGYASFLAISGKGHKLFSRGTRFMLEQPEFEDIKKLKNVFYALEVKINKLEELLLHYFNEQVKILIGDEIGFEEISDCSLVVSGSGEKDIAYVLALLGPMRMDYMKAVSCLCSIKKQFEEIIEGNI